MKEKPKVFWKYVTSKTRTKSRIGELYKDENRGQVSTTDKEKADILWEQLAGVFVKQPDGEPPQAVRKDVPRMDHMVITNKKIRKVIKKMKRNKSPGPDNIHPRIIKELMEELLEPLRIVFTSSLEEAEVPAHWREAYVTAIYNKGNIRDPGNYRPLSLTCTCMLQDYGILDKGRNYNTHEETQTKDSWVSSEGDLECCS